MKNLLAIFAVLVLTGILFSCHPEPAEGNPLTMEDGKLYSSSSLSSSSSSSVSSSSLRSSSSYVSSSSLLLSSSSSSLSSSSSSSLQYNMRFCVTGVEKNCFTIGVEVSREECLQYGTPVESCPSSSSSSSSISACVNPPLYSSFSTVPIGEQIWMAENLNYAACSSQCYNNQESNCEKYGRLYDWATAMMVCPKGWHLPSQEEWNILSNAVGGWEVAGKHLKAESGWNNNGNGIDSYSFNALPGGYFDGRFFQNVGSNGYWWGSTESDNYHAYIRSMSFVSDGVGWNNYYKSELHSVRCVQDFSILP